MIRKTQTGTAIVERGEVFKAAMVAYTLTSSEAYKVILRNVVKQYSPLIYTRLIQKGRL